MGAVESWGLAHNCNGSWGRVVLAPDGHRKKLTMNVEVLSTLAIRFDTALMVFLQKRSGKIVEEQKKLAAGTARSILPFPMSEVITSVAHERQEQCPREPPDCSAPSCWTRGPAFMLGFGSNYLCRALSDIPLHSRHRYYLPHTYIDASSRAAVSMSSAVFLRLLHHSTSVYSRPLLPPFHYTNPSSCRLVSSDCQLD